MRPDGKVVYIAIPNMGTLHKQVTHSLITMERESPYNLKYDFTTDIPIENCRNKIVRGFLAIPEASYLLFMDSDNPPMTGVNPMDLVELDKDIVACPTPIWKYSGETLSHGVMPIMWNCTVKVGPGWREHIDKTGLQEIDACGTGCILVARRVFEHPEMKYPFRREWDENGVCVKGSDFLFCQRAKEAGFRVWAHYDYPCSHFKLRDLLELSSCMNIRDIGQANVIENINTPEYWNDEWTQRKERIYPFYESIVKMVAGKRVLDYGCGRGDLMVKLKEAGCEVEGMDISETAVEICHSRGLRASVHSWPPYPDKTYDVVVCTQTLEHIENDQELIKALQSLAKEKLIYSVPYNCMPHSIEKEHLRVYTNRYIERSTPGLVEVHDFGLYSVVVSKGAACESSSSVPVAVEA